MPRRYASGRRFEWRVRDLLERQGYLVVRSAGSRGPFDLMAVRRGEVLLVECKAGGYLPRKRREELVALAESVGAVPVLAVREGRGVRMLSLGHGDSH